MRVSQFSGCCGANIFCDFGGTSTAEYKAEYTAKEVEDFLTKHSHFYANKLNLAILNEDQMSKFWPSFEKMGWKQKCRMYHPQHDKEVFLLTNYKVTPPENRRFFRKNLVKSNESAGE